MPARHAVARQSAVWFINGMCDPTIDLFGAAKDDRPGAVLDAITAGADLGARDAFGRTPAMVAHAFGAPAALRALLDAGVDWTATDFRGATLRDYLSRPMPREGWAAAMQALSSQLALSVDPLPGDHPPAVAPLEDPPVAMVPGARER